MTWTTRQSQSCPTTFFQYSFVDSDGSIRTVTYTADAENGFQVNLELTRKNAALRDQKQDFQASKFATKACLKSNNLSGGRRDHPRCGEHRPCGRDSSSPGADADPGGGTLGAGGRGGEALAAARQAVATHCGARTRGSRTYCSSPASSASPSSASGRCRGSCGSRAPRGGRSCRCCRCRSSPSRAPAGRASSRPRRHSRSGAAPAERGGPASGRSSHPHPPLRVAPAAAHSPGTRPAALAPALYGPADH